MSKEQKVLSTPKDGWEGLKENFAKDATAGFVVFLLALPFPSKQLGARQSRNQSLRLAYMAVQTGEAPEHDQQRRQNSGNQPGQGNRRRSATSGFQ